MVVPFFRAVVVGGMRPVRSSFLINLLFETNKGLLEITSPIL